MRTILKDEEAELEISDEGFDSPLIWITLKINSIKKQSLSTEIEVPLRDLMGALIGFDAKRSRFEDEIKQENP